MKYVICLWVFFLLPPQGYAKSKKRGEPQTSSAAIKLETKARIEIMAIANELQSFKTVRDWIDKAPRDLKVFRRMHFSSRQNESMPIAMVSSTSLVIIPKDKNKNGKTKERHLLEAKVEKNKIEFYLNARKITRLPHENMEKWIHRIYEKESKKKKSVWNWLFPKANAESLLWDREGNTDSSQLTYWSAIAASMSADRWQASEPSLERMHEAYDLANTADWMVSDNFLSCDSDNKAHFDYVLEPPAGSYFRVSSFLDRSANPPLLRIAVNNHPNSGMPTSGQQVGRLAIPVNPGGDGRASKVYTFNHREGSQEFAVDDWGIGRALYGMEVRQPGATEDDPSKAAFTQFSDYMPAARELMVMADVASSVCSNAELRSGSNVPTGGGTEAVQ